MSKSRVLVLALSLSVGLAGMNAGLPAGAAEAAPTSVTASPDTLSVAEAPIPTAVDVMGSGRWWGKAWRLAKCVGLGILTGLVNPAYSGVKFMTCYFGA